MEADKSGRLHRREFLKQAANIGLGLIAASVLPPSDTPSRHGWSTEVEVVPEAGWTSNQAEQIRLTGQQVLNGWNQAYPGQEQLVINHQVHVYPITPEVQSLRSPDKKDVPFSTCHLTQEELPDSIHPGIYLPTSEYDSFFHIDPSSEAHEIWHCITDDPREQGGAVQAECQAADYLATGRVTPGQYQDADICLSISKWLLQEPSLQPTHIRLELQAPKP